MIRKLEKKDIKRVSELGKTLKENFDVENLNELEKILVYEKDEKIIGFIDYIKLYETVEILYLVVDIDYRRKGIGTKLIEALLAGVDIKKGILEVRTSNIPAIALYEKNGFEIVRTIKNYYGGVEDAYAMEKVKK